jgi:hypothetical protein
MSAEGGVPGLRLGEAQHGFLLNNGQTGNHRSLATPFVRSKPVSLGATLSNLYRDIQIRMVTGFAEVAE